MHLSRLQFAAIVVGVAGVAAVTPVAAQTVVGYARNAGHVDGIEAVHATASLSARAGQLVATNRGGHLPNDIVRRVPRANDSDTLRGLPPAALAQQCGDGAVLGRAVVPANVSSTYEAVSGFATAVVTRPKAAAPCQISQAQAEHVGTGVYRVRLAAINDFCSADVPAGDAAVVVTPRSDTGTPLIATYRPVCDPAVANQVVDEVHISDTTGTPEDAAFAIELITTGGVPNP